MKKILFFAFALSMCIVACKKDPVTNTTTSKRIKRTTLSDTAETWKEIVNFYYDNNDNPIKIITTKFDTLASPKLFYDTTQIVTVNYANSLPSLVTIKMFDHSTSVTLVNTFNRYYAFNNQNKIVKDSLISFNLQFTYPYTSSYSYKDTISDLTDRQYNYSSPNVYVTSYNNHLFNKPFVWTNDTFMYVNDNATKVTGIYHQYNGFSNTYINTTSNTNTTYTNYSDPLYFGLLPFLGQSKNLINTQVETYNSSGNISTNSYSYQYFFDLSSNLIKKVKTSNYSILAGQTRISKTLYEYY